MTDLSHYRVGPAKTRDGRDAVIYAIHPGQTYPIHGALCKDDMDWVLVSWTYDGKYTRFVEPEYDGNLLPNYLPTIVARWLPPDGSLAVSDTEREGWTRVEVPMQPMQESVKLFGHKSPHGWGFNQSRLSNDTYRIVLPIDQNKLMCGDYRNLAGNVIKVERNK